MINPFYSVENSFYFPLDNKNEALMALTRFRYQNTENPQEETQYLAEYFQLQDIVEKGFVLQISDRRSNIEIELDKSFTKAGLDPNVDVSELKPLVLELFDSALNSTESTNVTGLDLTFSHPLILQFANERINRLTQEGRLHEAKILKKELAQLL